MGCRGCASGLPLALTESDVDIAIDLLKAPAQLLDAVCGVLDPAGQLAHLRFEPIHAQFGVDGPAGPRADSRGGAAVDLALQHTEVPFQAIQPILHPPVLRPCRRDRSGNGYEHEEKSEAGTHRDRTPYHREPLEIAGEPRRL
jgi:hypothetical protein